MKIKNLTKINEKLKEKKRVNVFEKVDINKNRNSNPSISNNLSYNQYLINNYNNQRKRILLKIPK